VSLICPACSASYQIDAAVLGPQGRKVRCAKCGNTWHAMPALETGAEKPAPVVERAAPPPKAPEPPKIEAETPQLRVIPPAGNKPATERPSQEEDRPRERTLHLTTIEHEEHETPAQVFFHKFFAFTSLVFLALLLATLVMARGPITQKAPWMLGVYNLLGISPLPPGGGITIVNVHDESRFGSVNNALVLTGQLVNHTPATLKVPLFKMEFTNPAGQTKTFMARSPVESIAAGAMVPFTLERTGFAQEGWNVRLTFGDGTEGDDTGKPLQSAVSETGEQK